MGEFRADRVIVETSLDPWLDLKGAARYCSLSRRSLARARGRRENPIPLRLVGGKLLIRVSELDFWIEREHRRQMELSQGALKRIVDDLAASVQDIQS